MDVITTHVNADFDSLGAMVAAKKLYPDALVVFPGSAEKTLRQFFLTSSFYAADVQKAKHVDLDRVTRLILVDVAQADRIGRFAALVGRPGVEIHLYDHHAGMPATIPAEVCRIESVGAATTVLVEILQRRRIPIQPEEATLMMLGIYEDTGSLTFTSTTPRDLVAAAFLLGQGADLNAVAEFLTPELTAEHVSLLDELLMNRTTHRIHGVEVTLAEASREQFVGDLAVLVHKMKEIENLDVIIAIARMGDRVYLVARSRVAEVDVSRVARAFGGGGHPEASSATIRDLTPIQVRARVLELLPQIVRPRTTARDLWSTPVKTLESGTPLGQADELLDRYHVNAMPVVASGALVGIVTRQIVARALQHGLLDVPADEYMITEFATVTPDAPLAEVQDRIIRGGQRFLPVVEAGVLVGAVTRTDLLRALQEPEAEEPITLPRDPHQRDAARLLLERVSPEVVARLRDVGRVARELGMAAYLVGGMVRDLLLRRDNLDVDVVVEGDGIGLGEALGRLWGAVVRTHRAFGTATLVLPDGFKIDLATARIEYYAEPAALPAVERSSLKLDLYRRDFTINTLALRLDPDRFGEIIDFFGGLRDLKEGSIRILHNLSFVEDPTRVLRALRFQLRFGFRLGRETQKLLRSAVRMGFVAQARGRRLFQEWVLLLEESDPVEALGTLNEFGVLPHLHPGLKLDAKVRDLVGRIHEVVTWFRLLYLETPLRGWLLYLLALFDPLADEEVEAWSRAFGVSDRQGRVILEARWRSRQALLELREAISRGPLRDSRVYQILHPSPPETLLFLMAKTRDDEKRRLISRYYTRLAGVTAILQGRDLRVLGIPPGPAYRDLLNGLLRARLDGEVETRDDEVEWVKGRWEERGRTVPNRPL
ncbi:MAG: CBS domain-containing protein [Deltaproteobacteria bacterium]|nr:CBS domain-containing protein [Deltaproteobacteria bacterium]